MRADAGLEVDLVVLSRRAEPLHAAFQERIEAQSRAGVMPHLIRVVGAPRPEETHRWQTIARARNEGFALSAAPWVMFLDDDVVLDSGCVRRLVDGLRARPGFAGLAADYLGESTAHGAWSRPDRHIAMGATLFRRAALSQVRFRSEPNKCECQCCCDDLRRLGLAIAYLPGARAWHNRTEPVDHARPERGCDHRRDDLSELPGRVLAAFDRRHFERFRRQFLGSLRAAGNDELVAAVGYGLYPSEQRILARTRGLELVARPADGARPPIRRLRDFAAVVASWPEATPAAYWDAGDVIFQSRLTALWTLVWSHPGKLLAVREPVSFPRNPAVRAWTMSIHDLQARRRAFALLSSRPFLNSGFAAGTAQALLAYFREADRMIHSPDLRGSTDWGDQTALNLYCHSDPRRWHEVDQAWNYCVHDRRHGEVHVRPNGRIVASSGRPIQVVHGNALSLPQMVISRALR
jgi:hypothetical protein